MEYEIGKVITYDGYCGEIVSESGKYLFLDKDVDSECNVSVGRLVVFRGEIVQEKKRAYFIRGAEKLIPSEVQKQKIKE